MKPPSVLIVDPDPHDLASTVSVLAEARYTVMQATRIPEAVGILARHRGKMIVLSELKVDGECGLKFLDDSMREYPFLTFTFLSSSPPLESVIDALKKGAYDFLRKPVAPDILLHSVGRSVQKLMLTLETEKQEKEIRKLLERSREDLKKAQVLSSFKSFMISMAAHDFRSIITVLDGYVQYIRDMCSGCDVTENDGVLDQAAKTIARLRSMANTLLDAEAVEAGSIRLDIRPFPLAEMLEECIACYKTYAEKKQVRLLLEWDPSGVIVAGDRDKVMEILDNLIYNALKFTPSGGTIRISGKKEDGAALLCVSDSGPGIQKEKLKKILERKEMVATLDSHARIGLGLLICKLLVEAQNGKFRIDSAPGEGTKVQFLLPTA